MTTVPSTIPRLLMILFVLALLGGCAPLSPREEVRPVGPPLATVRAAPDDYVGTPVRWGGTIAGVENRREETWIEIVEHPLDRRGRPQPFTDSGGRFIARLPGFLDPVIYAQGRLITVTGALESSIRRDIGEHPYTFPIVGVDTYHLWEERREPEVIYYYPYDYWWDPFYYRRYPFHRSYRRY